ncbi:MAG: NUDIX domain-containing protein [Clostridia bacterium]|nr:NUDIX domain-containing protein [Clostridia bacterium]
MRFTYCPDCGKKLIDKLIGDEGNIPYCEGCRKPLFDMFSSCVIVLVTNDEGQVVLLRQNYISTQYYNLVSGYIKPKETAEETAYREVQEEIGVSLSSLNFVGTFWFDKKDMLMIAFIGKTEDKELTLSGEVDEAKWVDAKQALNMVHPKGSVSYTLVEHYLNKINKTC